MKFRRQMSLRGIKIEKEMKTRDKIFSTALLVSNEKWVLFFQLGGNLPLLLCIYSSIILLPSSADEKIERQV